eukprot:TRINITY_DN3633_c0_g1_i1.p1 TRINITY_DN3633_c0_g1~~TRINITY_DN3633_c0_g1_i1.p1  ORF type:complete len:528 (-),score=167.82 TRINITY_DN3633_c0_g1_i1:268-1662(-)
MTIYSSKTDQLREVDVIPTDNWGGSGLLGVSIRFCSFYGVYENIYRILKVHKNSPAYEAKLQESNDYIVGTPDVLFNDTEDFTKLLQSNLGKQITIYVYNSQSESIRESLLTPREDWGGDGLIGCEMGMGLLHRIPSQKSTKNNPISENPISENNQPQQDYKQKLNELEQKFNDLHIKSPSSQNQSSEQPSPSNQVPPPSDQPSFLMPQPIPSNIPVPMYGSTVSFHNPVERQTTYQQQLQNNNSNTTQPQPTPLTNQTQNNTTSTPPSSNTPSPILQQQYPQPLPSNIPTQTPTSTVVKDNDMPPSDDQLDTNGDVSSLFGDSKSDGIDFFQIPVQSDSTPVQPHTEILTPPTPNNTPLVQNNTPSPTSSLTSLPVPNLSTSDNNIPTINPNTNLVVNTNPITNVPSTPIGNTIVTPQNTPVSTQPTSNLDFKQKLEELKRKKSSRPQQDTVPDSFSHLPPRS